MIDLRQTYYSIRQGLVIHRAISAGKRSVRGRRTVQLVLRNVRWAVIVAVTPFLTTCFEFVPVPYAPIVLSESIVYTVHANDEPGLALYRDGLSRGEVITFFSGITGDRTIAEIIAREASANDIPLSLAYSVAWAESRFYPRAVGRNHSSIDRGLFQLNSSSFPNLTVDEFFDPEVNARYGLAHLRFCLDVGRTEVVALAMYNAGKGRVEGSGTPITTLKYISNVLDFREYLETEFTQRINFTRRGNAEDNTRP